jgi:hypothetical protein
MERRLVNGRMRNVDPVTGEPIKEIGPEGKSPADLVAQDFEEIREHIREREPHHSPFGTRADPFGLEEE